jgi:hypothetical protein
MTRLFENIFMIVIRNWGFIKLIWGFYKDNMAFWRNLQRNGGLYEDFNFFKLSKLSKKPTSMKVKYQKWALFLFLFWMIAFYNLLVCNWILKNDSRLNFASLENNLRTMNLYSPYIFLSIIYSHSTL